MTRFTEYPAGSFVPVAGIVVITLPCEATVEGACWNCDCGAHLRLNDWMIAHAVDTSSSCTDGIENVGTGVVVDEDVVEVTTFDTVSVTIEPLRRLGKSQGGLRADIAVGLVTGCLDFNGLEPGFEQQGLRVMQREADDVRNKNELNVRSSRSDVQCYRLTLLNLGARARIRAEHHAALRRGAWLLVNHVIEALGM